jgi:Skp family chaperone for outer membrane proteins
MNGKRFNGWSISVALAAAAVGAGCASRGTVVAQAELTRAAASLEAAGEVRAYEGSADLTRARQKLAAAEKAGREGDVERARRLAVEADLDSRLAIAKADKYAMQTAVAELQQTVRTLQQDLRRSEQQSLGRLATEAP